MNSVCYYVYICLCSDATLYTGITCDTERRIREHNGGESGHRNKSAQYTRMRRPIQLVYRKKYLNRSEAAKEEYRIKTLSKKQKIDLIESNQNEYISG